MEAMRQSWTDERLDEFGKRIDERFDRVDERFDEVDRRFEQVDKRFEQVDKRFEQVDARLDRIDLRLEAEFGRVNDRLDGIQHSMVHAIVAFTAATIAGFVAVVGLIFTQL